MVALMSPLVVEEDIPLLQLKWARRRWRLERLWSLRRRCMAEEEEGVGSTSWSWDTRPVNSQG